MKNKNWLWSWFFYVRSIVPNIGKWVQTPFSTGIETFSMNWIPCAGYAVLSFIFHSKKEETIFYVCKRNEWISVDSIFKIDALYINERRWISSILINPAKYTHTRALMHNLRTMHIHVYKRNVCDWFIIFGTCVNVCVWDGLARKTAYILSIVSSVIIHSVEQKQTKNHPFCYVHISIV